MPTPIGNLEDITLRAVRILKEVDVILAEDLRHAAILLKHYSIQNKRISFHAFNEHSILHRVVRRMEQGERMALITDAGTPSIADPGFLLVRACLQKDLQIECLPGPTAFVPALIKSGFPVEKFVFEGFLPRKKGRQTALSKLATETRTVVLYESPHRIISMLRDLITYVGEQREVSVSREMTKIHEETITGTLRVVINHFEQHDVRGEMVVVLKSTS